MFKKRGQGLSITVIVAAVIGLIIIVVVVMMLTGKLGGFSKGTTSAGSCNTICQALGMDGRHSDMTTEALCLNPSPSFDFKYIPGKFSDVLEVEVCCCKRAK